jgi:hypothetical protein
VRSRLVIALCAACGGDPPNVAPSPRALEPIAIPSTVSECGTPMAYAIANEPGGDAALASLAVLDDEIYFTSNLASGRRYRRAPGVSILFGAMTATGGLDKAIVRRYLRRNLAKLQYCYERKLLTMPAIGGELFARFRIQLDGTVVAVEAVGIDPEVASCVRSVIGAIEFPRPRSDEVEVAQPITFRPPER